MAFAVCYCQPVSQSGTYVADSVYFELPHQHNHSNTLIAVNSFSADGFVPYSGGFWLYPRVESNTWENQQFSNSPFLSWQLVDTQQVRGPLKKANVVRVMHIEHNGDTSEQVYFVHVSPGGMPHQLPVVHIFVDSTDAFGAEGFYGPGTGMDLNFPTSGYRWNYALTPEQAKHGLFSESRIEKKASISVFTAAGTEEFKQHCGVRISGNSSVNYYNKSMALVARKQYSSHHNRFATSLYGSPGEYKWLKLRAGGSTLPYRIGANEIVLTAIDGLCIGETPVTPVVTYLNGSYWSLSFCQDKPGKYNLERLTGVDSDSFSVGMLNRFLLADDPMLYHLMSNGLDTSLTVFFTHGGNRYLCNGMSYYTVVSEGSEEPFEHLLQQLVDSMVSDVTVKNTGNGQVCHMELKPGDNFLTLQRLMNVDPFLYYLSVVDYFEVCDALTNNLEFAYSGQTGLLPVARDFDCAMMGMNSNAWQWYAMVDTFQPTGFARFITEVIMSSATGRNRLALAYQDVVNTRLNNLRLGPVAQQLTGIIDQNYTEMHESWGGFPNGGATVANQDSANDQHVVFCTTRQDAALQKMADFFMPEQNFTAAGQNEVRVVMDSLPANSGVRVLLNTLKLDTTWQGKYFPVPALHVSAIVPPGKSVRWKEYPDSAVTFNLNAHTDITLTPLLTDNGTGIEKTAIRFDVSPNPSSGQFTLNVLGATADASRDVTITDMLGRNIYSFNATQPVSTFTINNKGLYLLRMGNTIRKIEVQ